MEILARNNLICHEREWSIKLFSYLGNKNVNKCRIDFDTVCNLNISISQLVVEEIKPLIEISLFQCKIYLF
jgi:hypothetical protein